MISDLTSQVAERKLIFSETEYATTNIKFSVSLILNQYFCIYYSIQLLVWKKKLSYTAKLIKSYCINFSDMDEPAKTT